MKDSQSQQRKESSDSYNFNELVYDEGFTNFGIKKNSPMVFTVDEKPHFKREN
jgi:hypothetical protein